MIPRQVDPLVDPRSGPTSSPWVDPLVDPRSGPIKTATSGPTEFEWMGFPVRWTLVDPRGGPCLQFPDEVDPLVDPRWTK
jgi:hypothetical protein